MKVQGSALLAIAMALLSHVAEAHVSVVSGPAFAGKTHEITLSIPHGCDGADTFRVEVRIPDGVTSVRPLDSTFGKAVVSKDAGTGNVKSVTWTKVAADVLTSDTHLYKFSLSAKLPNAPFTTLFFPTIQSCRAADGTESTHEWVGTSGGHHHEGDAGPTPSEDPAPSLFLYPARTRGWNKYTVDQHVHDLTVFKDAEIVWAGNAAYSPNPYIQSLIEKEPNTRMLDAIHPDTEIWVRY